MPEFRVIFAQTVEAESRAQAVQLAGERRERERVHVAPVLRVTQTRQGWVFDQPMDVLDAAWDAAHDRSMAHTFVSDDVELRLPSFADLMVKTGWNPVQLSLLFDTVISAAVEAIAERGRRRLDLIEKLDATLMPDQASDD